MQPGTKKILRFLGNWAINTFAVVVAVIILRGHIRYEKPADLIIASLLLGILNAFVRPILMLLTLPLLISRSACSRSSSTRCCSTSSVC